MKGNSVNPDYVYIAATIVLTIYSQLVIKWQVSQAGALPEDLAGKLLFLLRVLFNPWVLTSLIATFLAALSWMAALSRFEFSFAYPFISLVFVGVLLASAVLFNEALTLPKMLGVAFIMVGIIIGSQR